MSCTSSPTLTSTNLVVTDSLSTSTTTHVTTLPPSTTTITITPACPSSLSVCPSLPPSVTTSEIPGETTTSVETVTITVPVTSSQLTTLFGTSCTQSDDSTNDPTPPVTSEPTTTTTTSTSTTSFSTPPPTVIVSESKSTQPDGVVTPVMHTVTSTLPPVAILPSATLNTNAGGSGNSDSPQHLGPIIGGTVGGVIGLSVIVLLAWLFVRRKRWDDIFDNDDAVPSMAATASFRGEKPAQSTPRPYQYGLVGYTESQSLTSSPNSRRPLSLTDEFDSHHRNNSTTPLLATSATGVSTSINASVSRPVSATSAHGYDANAQNTSWDPNRLYGEPTQQLLQPTQVAAHPIDVVAGVAAVRTSLGDPHHRAGSPVSFQERRVLQVMNADSTPLSPSSPAPRPSTPTGRSSLDPQRDGKGRLITKGEKAPIVHLDGSRYQEGAAGSSYGPTDATMPPSYSR
ncbi:hypothetical protein AGABI2DRAFT_114849 [Agaricus bisporus var. bisporus H97]|uniref:hypothetical protein n=1 Tax=Agaricus bisporus var. bisporus (strain H97 / ATCC MYA-4626 / FGSC 10389) TaxID=936046 RepID=UPI00029F6A24|nr:hypothetical protein AGABI2DRAFT_114849 [Agaricus bisporus var. bisporus H97]EKV49770.1 hypothetical protein AGABI2DRAFT_114849 [Agaricus bisporus var. bisporus H97]